MDPKKTHYNTSVAQQYQQIRNLYGPASVWEHKEKRTVITKSSLYHIYREILFQKVAVGYLLHFVQNGSLQNI